MQKILDGNSLVLGVCYYPEHWPEKIWADDLERMLECGIQVVRIAEFSWNITEPTEGCFNFDFYDRFLDLCQEKGMKAIFGTPTATPPAWLTKRYPEVLNAHADGTLLEHGGRRHYNYNSQVYREKTAVIVEQLAKHYGPHPAIIGWQIDNELNCEVDEFYSEADEGAFRIFLQEKYGVLNELNRAWGTVFWNQTYTDWDEIALPKRTRSGNPNPHALLDYARFISHSARKFALLQSRILRKYLKPGDFITTNGRFDHVDNHCMTRESLDFYFYDSYPNMAYCGENGQLPEGLLDREASRNLSEVRSVSPIFGIMEQQSGPNGWSSAFASPAPKPGQITLWTMQSIAHGADYVSYFRWRTCTFGTEMYWHGILDYSGRENRRIAEIRAIHQKLDFIQEVAGGRYLARTAILKDYDNCWDLRIDRWHRDLEAVSQKALYEAAQKTHTPVDYVYFTEDGVSAPLSSYNVLIYAHPCILSEDRVAMLEEFTAAGGTLILGCRSGYKDMDNHCVTQNLPGLLQPLTGADIPEFTRTCPGDAPVMLHWGDKHMEAPVFHDMLQPLADADQPAEVLAVYENCYYAGAGALLRHSYGKGIVYLLGTVFTEELTRALLEETGAAAPEKETLELPECCELAVREKNGTKYYFVLNYSSENAVVNCRRPAWNMIDRTTVEGEVVLEPYGTMVLRSGR